MCGIFLYLKFPFLSLLWIDVPYPLRPFSSATRSLKFFLFSFPNVISSLIFSVPQNFTPILLQHRHCFPVRFLSAFPVQPPSSWAEGLYLTHFRSSSAVTASSWSEPQSALSLVSADCIELLHLWLQRIWSVRFWCWPSCRVISWIVGKGCLLWPACSFVKTLLAFALLHFIL